VPESRAIDRTSSISGVNIDGASAPRNATLRVLLDSPHSEIGNIDFYTALNEIGITRSRASGGVGTWSSNFHAVVTDPTRAAASRGRALGLQGPWNAEGKRSSGILRVAGWSGPETRGAYAAGT